MIETATVGLILIVVNVIVSYNGFTNGVFFDKYKFEIDPIFINKDYKRMVTAGFLHIGWKHLVLNMLTLYAFSVMTGNDQHGIKFLIIYFSALIGGDLLALIVHRNHGDYSAVGASGAICGIIFAAIAQHPDMHVGFLFLPISIPGWLLGIVYVLYSMYGIKSKNDNIGHEAHLGGALVGMVVALLMNPFAFADNYSAILLIAIPTIFFIYLIITRPQILMIDNLFFNRHKQYHPVVRRSKNNKLINQQEIDDILEKINEKGMTSLSNKEKEKLKRFSKHTR